MLPRSIHILLIDDDIDDCLIFERYLRKIENYDYTVSSINSYEQGITEYLSGRYTVCFVDYRLDGSTGIELLQSVKEATRPTPLIMMTGVGSDDLGLEALRVGAADYLTKDSLSPEIIERAIRYALERQQTQARERELLVEQLERASIERERQILMQTFEQAPAMITLQEGATLDYTLVNPGMTDLLEGRSVIGQTMLEAFPADEHTRLREIIRTVYRTGKANVQVAIPVCNLFGARIDESLYYDFTFQPWRDGNGPVKGVLTFGVDVTRQVQAREEVAQSEQRMRFLAESMPQKIFTSLPDGEIDYVNNQWALFSGRTYEEIKASGQFASIHPEDHEQVLERWRHSLKTGENFQNEYRMLRADGVYRWHLTRAQPMRDKHGNIQLWLGSSTDVHDIKELERQKDDFIGVASHELKTPVTSMKIYAQTLQRRFAIRGETDSSTALERINTQIDRLNNLIDDLLDISRIESGKLKLRYSSFDMDALVKEVSDDMKLLSDSHDIRIQGRIVHAVNGDRERISQVLVNLFSNAIKYSPQSPHITVTLEEVNGDCVVHVVDHGIGIADEQQKSVFERFYRATEATYGSYPGLGLGLFISAEIVRRHNGRIWVEAEVGKGSEFSFSLPLNA